MTRVFLWIVAMLALAAAEAATAAESPAAKQAEEPVVALQNWAGCYIGANVGWTLTWDKLHLQPDGTYRTPAGASAPPNAAGTGALPGDLALVTHHYTPTDSGFTGGPQIGCNWMHAASATVFGIETDFNWTGREERTSASYPAVTSANPAFTIAAHTERVSTKRDWFSTVRARAGGVWNSTLIYGTAGLAVSRVNSKTVTQFGNAGGLGVYNDASHVGSASAARPGIAVGTGLEYAFVKNWSLKAEYLFLFFPDPLTYRSPLVAPGGVAAGYSWKTKVSALDEHVVRLGINYKFW